MGTPAQGEVTAPRAVVVIGASAGGVEALRTLVAAFPAGFPAAVCVTLHIPRTGISVLPQILSRAGALPATHPHDGTPLRAGHVHVAPVDLHLLLQDGLVRLSPGALEHGLRPAIDPLFRSAALQWGPRAAGVVLSGSGHDGTAGLAAITALGGGAFAQDPAEALFPSMPRGAAQRIPGCLVLPVAELGPALVAFVTAAATHRPGAAPEADNPVAGPSPAA
ncbi:chemotaxis protein CheB [Dactylosporangium sp. NPDC005555]|uniref:chemotaxis protein CheB n=1 Tax=Dactylosporangium sp. NPDC005555 TaxID=3154889 RepID=UPI0033A4DAC4